MVFAPFPIAWLLQLSFHMSGAQRVQACPHRCLPANSRISCLVSIRRLLSLSLLFPAFASCSSSPRVKCYILLVFISDQIPNAPCTQNSPNAPLPRDVSCRQPGRLLLFGGPAKHVPDWLKQQEPRHQVRVLLRWRERLGTPV